MRGGLNLRAHEGAIVELLRWHGVALIPSILRAPLSRGWLLARAHRNVVIVALANSRAGYITADLRPTRKNLLADGGRAIHFGKENYRAKAKRFAAAVTFTGAGQQDVVRGEPSREPEEQSQDS